MNIEDKDRCTLAVYCLKALVNNEVVDLFTDEVRIVHGEVNEGEDRFIAAWVRVGEDIYQPTFEHLEGQQVIRKYDREDFETADIIGQCWEYTLEEVLQEVESHKHFGPWHSNPPDASAPLPSNVIPLHGNTLH